MKVEHIPAKVAHISVKVERTSFVFVRFAGEKARTHRFFYTELRSITR
jgi:hypothetical protein